MAGMPMLSNRVLKAATADMRSLHDYALTIEGRHLRKKDPSYPVFMAKVPKGKGFIDNSKWK
jgi:hypothetical protein